MIQNFLEDPDGNTAIEFDDEGIEYLIEGLQDLLNEPVGTTLTTPAVWTEYRSWWEFWKPRQTPVVGEFRLRKIA